MAKLSKAQAKRRLLEAKSKFVKVYMSPWGTVRQVISIKDMEAVSKIVDRCVKKIERG